MLNFPHHKVPIVFLILSSFLFPFSYSYSTPKAVPYTHLKINPPIRYGKNNMVLATLRTFSLVVTNTANASASTLTITTVINVNNVVLTNDVRNCLSEKIFA